jgi:HD superfamily phosphodiesterase
MLEAEMYIKNIIAEMQETFKEIPYGIEHTMKVLKNAEVIMDGEGIRGEERELIMIVAILHDIGAVEALHKYGSIDGIYQEMEGPTAAKFILDKVGYESNKIDRICHIIGNHHTPSKIDGLDFQIQWEADLIENLLGTEMKEDKKKLQDAIDKNFRTTTGKALACRLLVL